MVGARSGTVVNVHVGCPDGVRTRAVPSPEMVKRCSVAPFGASSEAGASVTPPVTATSSLLPLVRTISVLPAGTDSKVASGAGAASLLPTAERITGGRAV